MVENVREDALNLKADALRYSEILPDAKVHIPVGQSGDTAEAAILIIQSQNRVAEVVDRSWPCLEKITKLPPAGRSRRDRLWQALPERLSVAEVADVITGAVFLTVSGRGKQFDRRAAARTEDRRERPAAQRASQQPDCPLKKGGW